MKRAHQRGFSAPVEPIANHGRAQGLWIESVLRPGNRDMPESVHQWCVHMMDHRYDGSPAPWKTNMVPAHQCQTLSADHVVRSTAFSNLLCKPTRATSQARKHRGRRWEGVVGGCVVCSGRVRSSVTSDQMSHGAINSRLTTRDDAKISPKVVNPRDKAGELEEEEEGEPLTKPKLLCIVPRIHMPSPISFLHYPHPPLLPPPPPPLSLFFSFFRAPARARANGPSTPPPSLSCKSNICYRTSPDCFSQSHIVWLSLLVCLALPVRVPQMNTMCT